MRKFLISFAMVSTALTAITPAMAQDRNDSAGVRHPGGPSRQAINELLRDLNRAESRIDRSVQRRIISRRESVSLRRQANQIRQRLNLALRNGVSGGEFGSLRAEVNRLEQRLRSERGENGQDLRDDQRDRY